MIKRRKKPCRRCKKPCVLFSRGLCYNCYRREYKPKKKPKKYKILSVSQAGYERNKAYKQARTEFIKEHSCCEVRLPECSHCDPESLTVHHKRGRTGKLLTDKRHFLAACLSCHRYIESHPEVAYANGWSESRLKKT